MLHVLRGLLLVLSAVSTASIFAQTQAPSWLEETMYRSGKMNTVVAVVAALLAGLSLWLFWMDRRLRRLERRSPDAHRP
jgi:cytochrome bd-type quinol oxidase subunit 2